MAIQTRIQLKSYFETLDVPTEQQYIHLIDSITSLGEVNGKTFVAATTNDYILWLKAILNDSSAHTSQVFRGLLVDVTATNETAWGTERHFLSLRKDGVWKIRLGVDGNVDSQRLNLADFGSDPTANADQSVVYAKAVTEIISNNVKAFAKVESGDRYPLVPYKLPLTLGAAATTFAADAPLMVITGDGGGNSVTTITGTMAFNGSRVVIQFTDGNVTLVHDNSHAANTIDLTSGSGASYTGADDEQIELMHDGISWYEVSGGSGTSSSATKAYGEISVEQNATVTTLSATSTDFVNAVQFLNFDTNGESSNTTPDHTNDHITIDKAGHYLVACSLSIRADSSNNPGVSLALFKNNKGTQLGSRRTESLQATQQIANIHLANVADLSVSDTIELWIQKEAGSGNAVIEDATLYVVMV